MSENRIGQKFYQLLAISNVKTMETWKNNDFLQKLKMVVRIVLHGPAISQSDCRKAAPYQLTYNKRKLQLVHDFILNLKPRADCNGYCTGLVHFEKIKMHAIYVMLHKRARLIDIVCARLITIGKSCEHSLSVLTTHDTTSNARPTSKDRTP